LERIGRWHRFEIKRQKTTGPTIESYYLGIKPFDNSSSALLAPDTHIETLSTLKAPWHVGTLAHRFNSLGDDIMTLVLS